MSAKREEHPWHFGRRFPCYHAAFAALQAGTLALQSKIENRL